MKRTWIRRILLGGALGMLALPIATARAADDDDASQEETVRKEVVIRQVEKQDGEVATGKSDENVIVEEIEKIVDGNGRVIIVRSDGENEAEQKIDVRVEVDDDGNVKREVIRVGDEEEQEGRQKRVRVRVRGEEGGEEDERIVWRMAELDDDEEGSPSDQRVRIRLRQDGDGESHAEGVHRILKQIHRDGDGEPHSIQIIVVGESEDDLNVWRERHGNVMKLEDGQHRIILLHQDEGEEDRPQIKVRMMHLGEDDDHEKAHEDHGVFKFEEGGQGVFRVRMRKDEDADHEHGDHEHGDHEDGDHAHSHDGDHDQSERRMERRVIRLDGDDHGAAIRKLLESDELPEEVRAMLRKHLRDNARRRVREEVEEFRIEKMPVQEYRIRRRGGDDDAEGEELRFGNKFEFEFDEEDTNEVEREKAFLIRRMEANSEAGNEFRWRIANSDDEKDEDDDNEDELDDRLEELEKRLIRLERKIDQILNNRR